MKLNELAINAYNTALKREKNGAAINCNEILKHAAGEVIEAAEARYYWVTQNSDAKDDYAEELADVIICALIAAGRDKIDIEKAVNEKMRKNAQRAALEGDKL